MLDNEKLLYLNDLCDLDSFNGSQLEQIVLGLEHGLPLNYIKVYADKKYDEKQMAEIREGFEFGLLLNEVELYLDAKYTFRQMHQIRLGLEHSLDIEYIKIYYNFNFDHLVMEEIRLGLEHGLTLNQVELYADETKFYNASQMMQIRLGIENGLTPTQIEVYANTSNDCTFMRQIRVIFEFGLSMEQVLELASDNYDYASRETVIMEFCKNHYEEERTSLKFK